MAVFSSAWLLVLVLSVVGQIHGEIQSANPALICPPAHLIKPCKCEKPWYGDEVELICSDILTQDQLIEVLEKSSDYAYSRFELRSSSISYIPISAFHIKKLTRISVEETSMVSLFDSVPPEDNVLERIELENVRISRKLNWKQFKSLSKLKEVRVLGVNLRKIDNLFRDQMSPSVEVMEFSNNGLTRIVDNSLSMLVNLKEVSFQNGQLKEVKRNWFASPVGLTDINFSINEIESIPADMFTEMPDLKSITFENNRITAVPQEVYQNVLSQLDYLYLFGNPIRCRCDVKWITATNRGHVYISGRCVEPEELQDRYLKTLVPGDFEHCQ